MVSTIIDKVKTVVGQVTSSNTTQKTVSSAKVKVTELAGSAQAAARQAAARAKAVAGDLSSRVPGKDTEAPDLTEQTGGEGQHDRPDGGPGLSPEAQATIDASRQRTHAFIQEAAVELETAPLDTPDDAQQVDPDVVSDPLPSAEDVDGAVREASTDRYQE